TQNTVGVSVIDSAMRKLKVEQDCLMSEMLGFRSNAVAEWRRRGDCPAYVALACEGLVRRHRAENRAPVVMVVRADQDKVDAVRGVLDALGVEHKEV
ncbi:MAG TPA: hypothetical protein VKA48_03725, partial [Gammaproteobacteria bacterium]|nr:hypothetical protein [Gammaproteobacteria bacterium]